MNEGRPGGRSVAVLVFPRGTDLVPERLCPPVGDVPRQKVGGGGQVARGLSFVLACHVLDLLWLGLVRYAEPKDRGHKAQCHVQHG